MLPTKGYFQDIECPYFNSSCGRPYCHFRHKKKQTDHAEEVVEQSEKETAPVVPTYKPTPKSQLATINNYRSHIPISYVPDLAFRSDKKLRTPKIENPTYNPTPLSILSSANRRSEYLTEENKEHLKVINEIKQNIANVEYDPTISDINFEELSNEFDLIDEIINLDETNTKYNSTKESKNKNDKGDNVDINDKPSSTKLSPEKEHLFDNSKEKRRDSNNKSNKTEKSYNQLTECDSYKQKETTVSKKDNKEKSSSDKKESSLLKKNDKKYKSKDKSRSPSQEILKNKDKQHSSKEKHKSRDESKNNKKIVDNSKHKETRKIKDSNKSEKEISEPKNDKKHSSDKQVKSERKDKDKAENKNHSHSKSKEHKSSKDDKKKKHSDKDKEKHKRKDRDKSKESKTQKVEEVKSEKMVSNKNEFNFLGDTSYLESDSDVDANEDETMLECYRIFNEYNPPPKPPEDKKELEKMDIPVDADNKINQHHGKKRVAHSNTENPPNNLKYTYSKPKTVQTPGQMLTNRYKVAKLAQANREQELLMNEVQQSVAVKRAAPSLLEAARERKKLRESEQRPQSSNLIDDILKGTTKPNPIAQKLGPMKIAPASNVLAMAKAKEKISQIKPVVAIKTVAHSQKGNRVAHVPDMSLTDIPDVLQADKSKLPVNVRTRFLTMLADECVKLYISKEEAYTRALKEEFNCYEKCKVLTSYRNSAMLAVNRLRKEILERNKTGLGFIGEDEGTGRESNKSKANQFYNQVKKWVLTDEDLDLHGYPQQSNEHGVAVIKNFKSKLPSNLDENQRICSRCHKIYQVDDDGWSLFEEECSYHPMKKRTIRGEQTYLCCRSSDEIGCATSDTHVSDGFISPRLEGFQTTMDSDLEEDPRSGAVYALDCEMCYTTKSLELTRVTIVDIDCKTIYETLVKPLNPIIDYNTKFSGITKEQMDKTSTSILQVQANILHLCNSQTILVGHSLESDMKALKIVHRNVIDTSVLFPHKMGLPHKRALRALASEYLRKIIQNDVGGHDSAEDAVTCMELLKWKLKEETKRRPSK